MNTDEHVTAGALAPALSGITKQATKSRSSVNRTMFATVDLPYLLKAAIPRARFAQMAHRRVPALHPLLIPIECVAPGIPEDDNLI